MANYTHRRKAPAQQVQQRRFRKAQVYAAKVLSDPLQREVYQRLAAPRKISAQVVLISQYLTPPTVERIVTDEYSGKSGGRIRVLASDDFEVVSVQVTIRLADNSVLEQGPAVKQHDIWNYKTTATAPDGQQVTIEAAAKDRAGNVTKATLVRTP